MITGVVLADAANIQIYRGLRWYNGAVMVSDFMLVSMVRPDFA